MNKVPLRITLWMPVLNEIIGLREIIPRIDRSLFHQILVIDGRSTDGSVEYCKEQGITVLQQPGKGIFDAECFAYAHTTGDVVILFTPDGNSIPELLPQLCKKMNEGYDMVIVSRYRDGAESFDDGLLTAFGNKFFTFLVNTLFKANYTDIFVGFRAYTKAALEKMRLFDHTKEHWLRRKFRYMNCWELGSSIRASRLGLRVTEIPGSEPPRLGGDSKLSIIKNGSGALMQIIYDYFYLKNHLNSDRN